MPKELKDHVFTYIADVGFDKEYEILDKDNKPTGDYETVTKIIKENVEGRIYIKDLNTITKIQEVFNNKGAVNKSRVKLFMDQDCYIIKGKFDEVVTLIDHVSNTANPKIKGFKNE